MRAKTQEEYPATRGELYNKRKAHAQSVKKQINSFLQDDINEAEERQTSFIRKLFNR